MLIIRSGKYKNKRLNEVDPSITRPSKDILKLGLFNIIGNRIINSSFLDLYGGSGQIGLEALSKGAKLVYINDSSFKAYQTIIKNKDITLNNKNNDYMEDLDKIKITNLNDFDFINKFKDHIFNIIFLDPPYNYNKEKEVLESLKINNLINKDTIIFIEKDTSLNGKLNDIYNIKEYKYGRSILYFLTLKEDEVK